MPSLLDYLDAGTAELRLAFERSPELAPLRRGDCPPAACWNASDAASR